MWFAQAHIVNIHSDDGVVTTSAQQNKKSKITKYGPKETTQLQQSQTNGATTFRTVCLKRHFKKQGETLIYHFLKLHFQT